MERVSGGVGSSATRVAWIKLLSLSFANILEWRRGWDSNPRAGYPTRRFRGAPVTTTSVPLREAGVREADLLLYRLPPGAKKRLHQRAAFLLAHASDDLDAVVVARKLCR